MKFNCYNRFLFFIKNHLHFPINEISGKLKNYLVNTHYYKAPTTVTQFLALKFSNLKEKFRNILLLK